MLSPVCGGYCQHCAREMLITLSGCGELLLTSHHTRFIPISELCHFGNQAVLNHAVLVLAGIELILFLVAGTVLCFGFSVRIMLITR